MHHGADLHLPSWESSHAESCHATHQSVAGGTLRARCLGGHWSFPGSGGIHALHFMGVGGCQPVKGYIGNVKMDGHGR